MGSWQGKHHDRALQRHWNDGNWIGVAIPKWLNYLGWRIILFYIVFLFFIQ